MFPHSGMVCKTIADAGSRRRDREIPGPGHNARERASETDHVRDSHDQDYKVANVEEVAGDDQRVDPKIGWGQSPAIHGYAREALDGIGSWILFRRLPVLTVQPRFRAGKNWSIRTLARSPDRGAPFYRDDTTRPMPYGACTMSAGTNVNRLASTAILIVGAPRSGTTWLAKILDSHPDVLYRHEPDEVVQSGGSIRTRMIVWVRQRDPRTAGKRPFFPKSWQPAPARLLRTCLAYAAAMAGRIGLPAWPIPDLGSVNRARVVIKSVRLDTGVGEFARACPDGRALLILRHPCGQVASVMRGSGDGRFDLAEPGTDMPFDEATASAFAALHGMDASAFQRQRDAAKYAWSWRAFNETAHDAVIDLSNARIVIYEDLCANPADQARAILEFAGLSCHGQTETFLARSTLYKGKAGYYAVVRNSVAAADRWRTSMTREDQDAVISVVRDSPLARYWPDMAA